MTDEVATLSAPASPPVHGPRQTLARLQKLYGEQSRLMSELIGVLEEAKNDLGAGDSGKTFDVAIRAFEPTREIPERAQREYTEIIAQFDSNVAIGQPVSQALLNATRSKSVLALQAELESTQRSLQTALKQVSSAGIGLPPEVLQLIGGGRQWASWPIALVIDQEMLGLLHRRSASPKR